MYPLGIANSVARLQQTQINQPSSIELPIRNIDPSGPTLKITNKILKEADQKDLTEAIANNTFIRVLKHSASMINNQSATLIAEALKIKHLPSKS